MTHHLTKLFALLEDGAIVPIAQPIYASLVRREIAMLEYASRCIRIADWYVGYEGDHAVSVDNETYQILWFDEAGRAWPEAAPGCDRHGGAQWIPTEPERQRVSKMILRESGEPRRADDRHVWAKR